MRKVGIVAVILLVVFTILAYVFPQPLIILWVRAQYDIEGLASANVVPSEFKKITASNISLGTHRLSVGYIQLTLDNQRKIEKLSNDLYRIWFPDNKVLSVIGALPSITAEMKSDILGFTDAEIIFPPRDLVSEYKFMLLILNSRPDNLSLMMNKRGVIATAIALQLKKGFMPPKVKGGYLLEIGKMKAFQMGDPKKGDALIFVHLFDEDGYRYQLVFKSFSQEEIDTILSSIETRERPKENAGEKGVAVKKGGEKR